MLRRQKILPAFPYIFPLRRKAGTIAGPPKTYQYGKLDPSKDEIRLLRILPKSHTGWSSNHLECSLFVASLAARPQYSALSYTWGDATGVVEISLDGYSFNVRQNLCDALHQLQHPFETQTYWIDAICINQDDTQERSKQVYKMKAIYSQACEVVIWLGDHNPATHLGFELAEQLYSHISDAPIVRGLLLNPENLLGLLAFNRLMWRDYWNRVWVIQEAHFAQSGHLTVRCGAHSIAWSRLQRIQESLASEHLTVLNYLANAQDDPLNAAVLLLAATEGIKTMEVPKMDKGKDESPPLYALLAKFWQKNATDPRDKIYALVGLSTAQNDSRFVIDYSKSVQEVFTDTVKYIVKSSNTLEVICSMPQGVNPYGLPSWVPDWTVPALKYGAPAAAYVLPTSKFQGTYTAADKSVAEIECLHDKILLVLGFCIDKIRYVGSANNISAFDDLAVGIPAILDWFKLYRHHQPEDLKTTTSYGDFVKTIILDRYFIGLKASDINMAEDIEREKTAKSMRAAIALGLLAERYCPGEVPPDLTRLSEGYHLSTSRPPFDDHAIPEAFATGTFSSICRLTACRRFFVTASNHFGIVPEAAEPGDLICILLGCALPVVLRPVNGHYILLGEAYVHGYMYGKGMKELEQGKFELETFEIH
ncbi:heterokaryon incompatibility protein-domain-containing protein [Rhexocercosporidium sp. MPI-PUGE-AT-0058]|nr:heterokaryon incompatibility protein-domain-containing protein [Rhexocercosporidium sp. MPI-PUGE-AT-0058]